MHCLQCFLSLSLARLYSSVVPSYPPFLPPFSPPEGANFRNILDKAVQADQVVKDRYNTHCDMIALLCKPENELNAAIPSANPTKTLQGSEVCVDVLISLLFASSCKTLLLWFSLRLSVTSYIDILCAT